MSTDSTQQINSNDPLSYDQSLFVKGGMKAQVDYYNQWQIGYDNEVEQMNYGGPQELIKIVTKYVDKKAKIIDVVAGSGILGEELKRNGFENIEALDGAQKMLDIAKERNIYRKYHCQLLEPNKPTNLPEHSFDAAVASGCFGPGHLNSGHLSIFASLVRNGGKVAFVINDKFFKDSPRWKQFDWDHDLEGAMKDLESKNVWKRLESSIRNGYFEGVPGRYFVFEIL